MCGFLVLIKFERDVHFFMYFNVFHFRCQHNANKKKKSGFYSKTLLAGFISIQQQQQIISHCILQEYKVKIENHLATSLISDIVDSNKRAGVPSLFIPVANYDTNQEGRVCRSEAVCTCGQQPPRLQEGRPIQVLQPWCLGFAGIWHQRELSRPNVLQHLVSQARVGGHIDGNLKVKFSKVK